MLGVTTRVFRTWLALVLVTIPMKFLVRSTVPVCVPFTRGNPLIPTPWLSVPVVLLARLMSVILGAAQTMLGTMLQPMRLRPLVTILVMVTFLLLVPRVSTGLGIVLLTVKRLGMSAVKRVLTVTLLWLATAMFSVLRFRLLRWGWWLAVISMILVLTAPVLLFPPGVQAMAVLVLAALIFDMVVLRMNPRFRPVRTCRNRPRILVLTLGATALRHLIIAIPAFSWPQIELSLSLTMLVLTMITALGTPPSVSVLAELMIMFLLPLIAMFSSGEVIEFEVTMTVPVLRARLLIPIALGVRTLV